MSLLVTFFVPPAEAKFLKLIGHFQTLSLNEPHQMFENIYPVMISRAGQAR